MAEEQQPSGGYELDRIYVWVKGLETKVNNLLREVDLLKNDSLRRANALRKEVKALNDDVLELKHGSQKAAEQMGLIIKELKRTAGVEEVRTIQKYLELWSPLEFVTQRDVERVVRQAVEQAMVLSGEQASARQQGAGHGTRPGAGAGSGMEFSLPEPEEAAVERHSGVA